MNARSTTTAAALLFTSASLLHAQIWDGGGLNNNISNPANWNPNGVPANNGTASLVFTGVTRPQPVVDVSYDVAGVNFVSGATTGFGISAAAGRTLTVRGVGIFNNSLSLHQFTAPVIFGTGSSITAVSGPLDLLGGVNLGPNTVTVSGSSNTTINSLTGTGTLVKSGVGVLAIQSPGTQTYGLTLIAGTVDYSNDVTFSGATTALSVAGGSLSPSSNFTLSGGASLDVAFGAQFVLQDNRMLTVQDGASATFEIGVTMFPGAILRVTGANSEISIENNLNLSHGSAVEVLAGGSFNAESSLLVGSGAAGGSGGSFLVDGPGSAFTIVGTDFVSFGNGAGSTATLTVDHGGTASFTGLTVVLGTSASSIGTMTVRNGGAVTAGTVNLSPFPASGAGHLLIAGPGSKVTAGVAIGAAGGGDGSGSGTVTLADGGELDPVGPLTIHENGTLTMDGGILTMDPGEVLTNNGHLNFIRGRFNAGDHLNIGGAASPLGTGLTLPTGKEIIVPSNRTTIVGPTGALVLDGGLLSTGSLVNGGGTIDLRRGTLRLTGAGGLAIGGGSSSPLGANVSLPPGAVLEVTAGTTVASGALLSVDGGSFSTRNLNLDGTILLNAGIAIVNDGVVVSSSGQFVIAREFTIGGTLTVGSGGRLELAGGTGRISTTGSVANNGLLTGSGTLACTVNNNAGGKVRADSGKTLYFTGTFNANAGELQIQGGTLDFLRAVTNSANGFISGRGALYTAALTNNGVMAFSGGNTDIHGDTTNAAGARIVTSGAGSVTTFFDDVTHNGTEIFTGAGCSTVFFGAQSGTGSYTGTGTVYFIGDLRPGSSPGIVTCSPEAVFSPSSGVRIEIGGLTPGTQHDKLVFTSAATPQVEWNGTLAVTLLNGFTPAAGQSFDVLDFDPARDSGGFATLSLPALPNGLAWDTAELYTTGTLRVISTAGLTFAQWAATVPGNPAATPGGDHDSDGFDNGAEFALGLFPPQPGTMLPTGGFFTYPDGERLRILFTRPLDRTGVTLKVQASSDLVVWEDLAVSVNSAPFAGGGFVSENRAHPLSEPGLVEVRDTLNASGEARRNLRILVTLSP